MNRKTIYSCLTLLAVCFTWLYAGPEVKVDKVLIEKKAHRLSLYSGDVKIKSYKIAIGRGGIARKTRKGDKLTPEGNYRIDGRKSESGYHLALHISYPNKKDVALANASGVDPGGDIMIHGIKNGFGWIGRFHIFYDWTAGCIALSDAEIEEIWKLVPDGTLVEIRQ